MVNVEFFPSRLIFAGLWRLLGRQNHGVLILRLAHNLTWLSLIRGSPFDSVATSFFIVSAHVKAQLTMNFVDLYIL